MRLLVGILLPLLASACSAEGNSYLLGKGEPTRFLSLNACEAEAQSSFTDGSPKYSGYECRKLLFDRWVIAIVRYENARRVAADGNP